MIRRGFTLIELTISIAILGIGAALVGLSFNRLSHAQAPISEKFESARRQAILLGRSVLAVDGADTILFQPDGSALPNLRARSKVNSLTGAILHDR